jgi:SAM-dependent methyltransferase
MKQLSDWYRHPRYYEAVFGPDTEREMDFLQAVNAAHGTGGRVLLEPACGAGRLVEAAVRRGHSVVGYDLSPQMLAHAHRRLPPPLRRRAHLSCDRMETFCPPRWVSKVDLAFSLVSTFRYLDSDEAALAHLRATRRLLRPGGVYALGFHLTDYARDRPEHERWVGQVGDEEVVCNTREWPPERRLRRARMRNRLRISGPRGRFVIQTDWYFRTWSQDEAAALLERAGFELVGLYGFDTDLAAPLSWDGDRLDRLLILRPT